MNLIKKQHLDFQKFDNPMEVLNRDDKSTLKIRSQDERFNPAAEKTFSHPYNAGDGVVIYNVEDSKEGQKAVRRAMDFYFGYDKNFWCLASRKDGFRRNEINRLTREQAEKLGFYSDDALAVAWNYWKANSAYPKRIAFKNGKLFAFSAGKHKQHVEWWDRNDKSHYDIPESNAVDDIEFLKKYGKLNLLENNNASPEIIEELVKDEDKYLREEVAKHPNTPVDILRKLAENDKDGDVRREVVKNPNTTVDILIKLAEDKHSGVKQAVAYNPNTPVDILRKLAENDKDGDVRREVVKNPNTTVDILMTLAGDRDWVVRWDVARNLSTPADILIKLAGDKDSKVIRAVVHNPNTPAEALRKLAEDENVISQVAKHPNTPADILMTLAGDKNVKVREGVAMNSNATVDILKKLAEDRYWLVKQAVAYNPNTPVDILRKLAGDKDEDVRQSAISQLSERGL